ncbi:MAG TPA: dihydroorotase [Ruminococcus sp.]|nr:dihydroorotase [Ruminococcus sp.]
MRITGILIKNVDIVDIGVHKTADIYIKNGLICEIAENISPENNDVKVIDAKGLTAMPALMDMHVHFRDPGFTYKEDIVTGASAAAAGGFTAVACMPNTKPAIDNVDTINYITTKARNTGVRVYPVGCITKKMKGDELCDYKMLKRAGAVALSDDGKPVKNAEIMRRALEKADENDMLVISHCEDLKIINKGIMHKGAVSELLGVPGMDRASEDTITAREIILANSVNSRVHIAHVSTAGSIDIIRYAKHKGVKVTCETCPHYFMLTHEKLMTRDADYRMNPPLREESDREAVLQGIIDGTVDCIVTDHAPHAPEEKENFREAPNGVVGLETSLAAVLTALYHTDTVPLERIVELMSVNPRKLLNLPVEKIKTGFPANIVLADLNKEWIVDPSKLHSKSHNTVFKGMTLKGKPVMTISNGNIIYSEI